jgi:hypothetical protein
MKSTYIYIYIYPYPMSLTSMTRSCSLLRYRTLVEVEWFPVTRKRWEIYYCYCYHVTITWDIYIWIIIGDRTGLGLDGLDLVGQQSGALVAFVLPTSIKDRLLLWTLVRSQAHYPEHILAYGSGKTCYSHHGFRLFLDQLLWVDYWIGGLSTTLRLGLQSWGLGVLVWTGTWTPWQEWNGLVFLVPGVQARCVCFSGYPAGLHWFANRHFYVTVRLGYSLAL